MIGELEDHLNGKVVKKFGVSKDGSPRGQCHEVCSVRYEPKHHPLHPTFMEAIRNLKSEQAASGPTDLQQ